MLVMKNREKCYLLLQGGKPGVVKFSALINTALPHDYDVILDQHTNTQVMVADTTIMPTTLMEHMRTLFDTTDRSRPVKRNAQSLAFINKSTTAPFADGWLFYRIRLADGSVGILIVYLQEKQSIVAKMAALQTGSRPKQHTAESIEGEYAKCNVPAGVKHLFVFASDSGTATQEVAKPHVLLLFGDNLLEAAMGAIPWEIRSNTTSASCVDATMSFPSSRSTCTSSLNGRSNSGSPKPKTTSEAVLPKIDAVVAVATRGQKPKAKRDYANHSVTDEQPQTKISKR